MSIYDIIDNVVSYIAKEWSLGNLNSCTDFDKIARELKNRYPRMNVHSVNGVAQVLALLNSRDVVSIYDTYCPLDLLWCGSVEDVPERYKSAYCFSMKHTEMGYQLYI